MIKSQYSFKYDDISTIHGFLQHTINFIYSAIVTKTDFNTFHSSSRYKYNKAGGQPCGLVVRVSDY